MHLLHAATSVLPVWTRFTLTFTAPQSSHSPISSYTMATLFEPFDHRLLTYSIQFLRSVGR